MGSRRRTEATTSARAMVRYDPVQSYPHWEGSRYAGLLSLGEAGARSEGGWMRKSSRKPASLGNNVKLEQGSRLS